MTHWFRFGAASPEPTRQDDRGKGAARPEVLSVTVRTAHKTTCPRNPRWSWGTRTARRQRLDRQTARHSL